MSYTLLLRLAGPMQSWGVSSRFSIRETLLEPSKSGIIGLLCAATGWDRAADTHDLAGQSRTLVDLARLLMGVRVIREGVLRRDYHTAQNVLRAKAKLKPGKAPSKSDLQETVLSDRYYLSDAYFIVGLQCDDEELLLALDKALSRPRWPLCLGRKAFVPSLPVRWGTVNDPTAGVIPRPLIEAVLEARDPLHHKEADQTKRLVCDNEVDTNTLDDKWIAVSQNQRTDVPLSFSQRRFAPRDVLTFMPTDYVSF